MAVIGVIAQGMMGAGVGRRLHETGAEVRTLLTGRSEASAERAKKAGMAPAANERELPSAVKTALARIRKRSTHCLEVRPQQVDYFVRLLPRGGDRWRGEVCRNAYQVSRTELCVC